MVEIITEQHGDVHTIMIVGEFYLESVEYAEQVWNEISDQSPRAIGINCSKIKYIDSSAIGVLVKFLNIAMKNNIDLLFFDLSDAVVSVFKTAKLGNFFKTMSKNQFELEYITP